MKIRTVLFVLFLVCLFPFLAMACDDDGNSTADGADANSTAAVECGPSIDVPSAPCCPIDGRVLSFEYEGIYMISWPIKCEYLDDTCYTDIIWETMPGSGLGTSKLICDEDGILVDDIRCFVERDILRCPVVPDSDMMRIGDYFYPKSTEVVDVEVY